MGKNLNKIIGIMRELFSFVQKCVFFMKMHVNSFLLQNPIFQAYTYHIVDNIH